MLFRSIFISILFVLSAGLHAQIRLDSLAAVGAKTLGEPAYADRKQALEQFTKMLKTFVASDTGFSHPLKEVGNVLRLPLGDDAAIYTWQVPDSSFNYQRYGLVAARVKDEIVLTELEASQLPGAEFMRLKPENWYGAIYYEAIPVEKGRDEYYTLLGLTMGQDLNRKVIDVIEIDRKGRPRFGAKIFRVQEWQDRTFQRAPMRLILQYSPDISASVKWNEDEEMIVMDHLSPPDENLKGIYQQYGPDMSYDALEWEDDWWQLTEEVKFNTRQNIPIIPPDKPTDLPPKSGGN